jgi:hypothetical protein
LVINLRPAKDPLVLRYGDPHKRVYLSYRYEQTRITLGSGEMLSQLALWQMLE